MYLIRLPLRRVLLAACLLLAGLHVVHAAPPANEASAAPATNSDAAASRRLQTRLSDLDLKSVTANVDGGVAELGGHVLQHEHKQDAGRIAANTPGVVAVANNVVVDGSLHAHFRSAWSQVTGKLATIAARAPLLVVSILIVLLAMWLGRMFADNLHVLRLRTDNPYMDGLIRNTIRIIMTLVGLLLALNLLGLTSLVGAVLGSAGVVGLALGFAFKDIAENYIAGILLSVRKPFSPGEHIKIDSYEGKVVALSSRATVLMTLDGNQLLLPNALVFKSVLLNYSQNPRRRFDFGCIIDGAQSIRHAQTLALEAYSGIDGVLDDPAPSWTVVENAPGGIELRFYGWVDQRASDLGKVRSESIRLVKAAFAGAGIEAPRSVYHVLTSRDRDATTPINARTEPTHVAGTDTSVNREIDDQLADAQLADDTQNMLNPGEDKA